MPIDYKKYPPNWKTEIVPAVIKRAENKCEDCGLENKSFIWSITLNVKADGGRYTLRSIWFRVEQDAKRELVYGVVRKIRVVLTVAHLDHDEMNMEISVDRLKALCQICHLRYDAKEKYRRVMQKGFEARKARELKF